MRHNKQSGFTLIELVVVIVILGILAGTAVSKFVNLRDDAKIATLESVAGAMRSGLTLVYTQAALQGKITDNDTIDFLGTEIPVYNGYPAVDGNDDFVDLNEQVKAWLEIDAVDRNTRRDEYNNGETASSIFFTDKSTASNYIYLFFSDDWVDKSASFECQVLYQNPEGGTPSVTLLTDAC